jgi:hypothetical protein
VGPGDGAGADASGGLYSDGLRWGFFVIMGFSLGLTLDKFQIYTDFKLQFQLYTPFF